MFSHFFDYSCDVIHGFVCHFFVIYSFLLGLKGNLLILSTFSLTFLVFFSILSWIGFISSWIIVLVLFPFKSEGLSSGFLTISPSFFSS